MIKVKLRDVDGVMEFRDFGVAWCVPMDETLFSTWFSNWTQLRHLPWDEMYFTSATYLPEARNTIHNRYLEKSPCKWMVMLDSDVMPPLDFLDRLLKHKKPMVGGWYRMKLPGRAPVVYDVIDGRIVHKKEPGAGLEAVDVAGAGCWLMHRTVAEAIGQSPYDMKDGGEDLALCRKVHDAGFETFIDWSVECLHLGVGPV